jgi:hypothetical protein
VKKGLRVDVPRGWEIRWVTANVDGILWLVNANVIDAHGGWEL